VLLPQQLKKEVTMELTRRFFALMIVGFIVSLAFTPASAAPGDVKAYFDIPCKYPSGLACDGAHFYLADWRSAEIYTLSPVDGKVEDKFAAPTLKPHGLTFGHGTLYVSDDHTGFVYALNLKSGIVENSFEAPGPNATGLAFVGDALYILEKQSAKIYKVLPEDGTILSYFDAPDRSCETMTYDGRYLWVSNRINNELYMVNPSDGMVIGILDSPGPYAAGLAWHDGDLWNVDFQNRKLYRLTVEDKNMYRLSDTREARVEYLWALNNYGPGEVEDLELNVAVPEDLPNQVLLSAVDFSVAPSQTGVDKWGQKCNVFELGNIPAGSKKELTFHVNTRASAIRYLIIPEKTGDPG
jgi:outer membrane protein assembly factor BamB